MSDRAEKLMELSVASKRYAEAIVASMRASDSRAALGPHATRARITSANARWARCAEDRDRKEERFNRALKAFDGDYHSEDSLDMVGTTCKDVLQVADETASKKSWMPGLYGPLWEFSEQRIREFASRLASAQQAGDDGAIYAELDRAIAKFPTWPSHALHAIAVVNEEIGELNKAILQAIYEPHKSGQDEVRSEAIQAAAMAIRFVRSLDRYNYAAGEQHAQQAGGGKGGA